MILPVQEPEPSESSRTTTPPSVQPRHYSATARQEGQKKGVSDNMRGGQQDSPTYALSHICTVYTTHMHSNTPTHPYKHPTAHAQVKRLIMDLITTRFFMNLNAQR